ncbi:GNAT family N-acetyltransferase [Lacicoccus alkaliphilus]|uniref:Ribosomal-protein-alanine N-acetyltransferase n=1 Tax=Lacicoccus alkaliphilus DSM 16010 TaxID=1123231 RepID=A0A1M7GYM0_9BACL|nr:GNAT family protein [Salinicoccus alkaliphilus]SHM21375.1 ribosomal-protein-alanine N-acetyltransferase [Salinicoccus alkaliphilus DSM 16010]
MDTYKVLLAKHDRLETPRLCLRPVTLKDTVDMHEYASDEETTYYVFDRHESYRDTEKAIVGYFLEQPLGKYGIELKDSGKMIGTIELRRKTEDSRGIIGYTLNKDFHGNGYMTEAGKAILKLGFESLSLDCIAAMFDERNTASGKVLERLGMQKEGVLRHVHKWKQGEYFNDVYYSILKTEYEEQQSLK